MSIAENEEMMPLEDNLETSEPDLQPENEPTNRSSPYEQQQFDVLVIGSGPAGG